eukprot:gb/GFBE01038592.1/.p1 GENE.gb/GFBE01038592.1/~~gb/GFBE01038592.1/.p1  ORF type:complete len:478 (+),score=57.78 gb/GFBE01038592.1/:1-1434(+)
MGGPWAGRQDVTRGSHRDTENCVMQMRTSQRHAGQPFSSTLPKIESGVYLNELCDRTNTPRRSGNKVRGTPPKELSPCAGLTSSSGDESEDFQGSVICRQASPGSVVSVSSIASSGRLFAEPAQTLLFLDWDDTIFPCSELFHRRGLPRRARDWTEPLSSELDAELEPWRRAVEEFLRAACAVSDRCVIVTNSKAPWVMACVEQFAPCLLPFFNRKDGKGAVVVYAAEALRNAKASASSNPGFSSRILDSVKPWLPCGQGASSRPCSPAEVLQCLSAAACGDWDPPPRVQAAQRTAELTKAKLEAMRQEAHQFYSRYPGQTWKNVLSLGDMKYEHDAVKELSASRVPSQARERLRTKSFVLPTSPLLSELTLQLRVWSHLLPACARFDGELDMDLSESEAPLEELSRAMHLPQLARLQQPYDTLLNDPESVVEWGIREVEDLLDELAVVVHETALFPSRCFQAVPRPLPPFPYARAD